MIKKIYNSVCVLGLLRFLEAIFIELYIAHKTCVSLMLLTVDGIQFREQFTGNATNINQQHGCPYEPLQMLRHEI
jgi:hypothetical protein